MLASIKLKKIITKFNLPIVPILRLAHEHDAFSSILIEKKKISIKNIPY
jgi:hypothetical protein